MIRAHGLPHHLSSHSFRLFRSSLLPHAASARVQRGRTRVSLYDLLGVDSTATIADVRTAYRRLATLYHPDVNPSLQAHEKFQAVKLAADVLTSEPLRQRYDQQGLPALAGGEYQRLHDFLARARVQGAASVIGEPGGDISTVLGLDFGESVTGSACTVTTGALGICPDCKGSGIDEAARATDCPMCHGRGEITVKKWVQSGQPRVAIKEVCPGCKGIGKSELHLCSRCGGEGRVQVRRHVRIRVPAGVVDGQVLRVKGQGHSGKFGGAPGDLLVKLQVYCLEDVTRKGDDLYSQLVVSVYEAVLGCSVDVKTVRGQRSLIVPAGTQHGQFLCARNAGVARPGVNGVEYGHHYFEVSVQIPSSQSATVDELELLTKLAQVIKAQGSPEEQQQPQVAPQGSQRAGC